MRKPLLLLAVLLAAGFGCASARESYVQSHPRLEPPVRAAILAGELVAGMSPDEVRASWGAPDHESSRYLPGGRQETTWSWGEIIAARGPQGRVIPGSQRVISKRTATFFNGRLDSWSVNR